jgi:putative glutamine transport system substrate-binding protein
MKKLLIVVFTLLINGALLAQGLSGDTWATTKTKKQGKITVTYAHTPKFAEVYMGERKGLCFDIMYEFVSYVQAKHGVQLAIEYKNLSDLEDFELFLKTIKSSKGGVFGLGDVTITNARKQEYNFSTPYFSNVVILATNNKVPTLSNLANINKEFAGKTIVVQNATTHESRANALKKNFPELVVETTKGINESNQKVVQDIGYFTYIDFSTYLDVMTNHLPLKRHEVGDHKGEDFGFIMPKDSDWAPVFNEFMAANGGFTNSMTYRKMLASNLGTHVLKLLDAIN